jgi:hypothetical protein
VFYTLLEVYSVSALTVSSTDDIFDMLTKFIQDKGLVQSSPSLSVSNIYFGEREGATTSALKERGSEPGRYDQYAAEQYSFGCERPRATHSSLFRVVNQTSRTTNPGREGTLPNKWRGSHQAFTSFGQ